MERDSKDAESRDEGVGSLHRTSIETLRPRSSARELGTGTRTRGTAPPGGDLPSGRSPTAWLARTYRTVGHNLPTGQLHCGQGADRMAVSR